MHISTETRKAAMHISKVQRHPPTRTHTPRTRTAQCALKGTTDTCRELPGASRSVLYTTPWPWPRWACAVCLSLYAVLIFRSFLCIYSYIFSFLIASMQLQLSATAMPFPPRGSPVLLFHLSIHNTTTTETSVKRDICAQRHLCTETSVQIPAPAPHPNSHLQTTRSSCSCWLPLSAVFHLVYLSRIVMLVEGVLSLCQDEWGHGPTTYGGRGVV
jgi:hypothetical protein